MIHTYILARILLIQICRKQVRLIEMKHVQEQTSDGESSPPPALNDMHTCLSVEELAIADRDPRPVTPPEPVEIRMVVSPIHSGANDVATSQENADDIGTPTADRQDKCEGIQKFSEDRLANKPPISFGKIVSPNSRINSAARAVKVTVVAVMPPSPILIPPAVTKIKKT